MFMAICSRAETIPTSLTPQSVRPSCVRGAAQTRRYKRHGLEQGRKGDKIGHYAAPRGPVLLSNTIDDDHGMEGALLQTMHESMPRRDERTVVLLLCKAGC